MSWQLINRYNINENKWNEVVSLSRSRHITGPVSYTHLDVYKRQQLYIAILILMTLRD